MKHWSVVIPEVDSKRSVHWTSRSRAPTWRGQQLNCHEVIELMIYLQPLLKAFDLNMTGNVLSPTWNTSILDSPCHKFATNDFPGPGNKKPLTPQPTWHLHLESLVQMVPSTFSRSEHSRHSHRWLLPQTEHPVEHTWCLLYKKLLTFELQLKWMYTIYIYIYTRIIICDIP